MRQAPPEGQRVFEFDGDPWLPDATRAIAAALDDEGQCLMPNIVGGQGIRSVRQGARTLVIVPRSRIGTHRDGRSH